MLQLVLALQADIPIERLIRAWNARIEEASLSRVDVAGVRGFPGLHVARLDHIQDWSGSFGCYQMEDSKIAWQATVDQEPTEQSILSVRGWNSLVVGAPLIEVIGQTHMGNGSLYLYELRERALRLVLKTRAYDCNPQGEEMFRGGVLGVDVQGGRITLKGVIQEIPDEKDDQVVAERACGKTFVWDPKLRRFTHDAARRFGFREPETW